MRRVMVRYRVRPGEVARNEELVRAVYAALAEVRPDGFAYTTFKLPDGVSFMHIALQEADGPGPLPDLAAFREFSAGIGDRCDEPPVVTELEQIGAYGL